MELKYPYYSENPRLDLATVKTVDGETEYRNNCKRLDGLYYVKGVHLVYDELERTWYLPSTGSVSKVFDHELQKDVVNSKSLITGVVDYKNNKCVIGYFSENPLKNGLVYCEHGTMMAMNIEDLIKKGFKEVTNAGQYLAPGQSSPFSTRKVGVDLSHHVYNIEDNAVNFTKSINVYEKSPIEVPKNISRIEPYIKGLKFGAELETVSGTLPQHLLYRYGLIICKDGSIKNGDGMYAPEYVTVPLSGAKGIQTLYEASKEIAKRSDIDLKCSYHIHLSGANISRVYLTSLYRLCYKIQNDVFKMFPYYKTDPTGIKDKNYCKKLPNIMNVYKRNTDFNDYINTSFTDLFLFLSGGLEADKNVSKNGFKSKQNPWGREKWNCKTRYHWVNLINPIFGKRDTIEFRLHTPTLNGDKIVNWLLMCNAIMRYAETNVENCIKLGKISFKDVLNYYADEFGDEYSKQLSENLIKYYENRVSYFEKDFKNNDRISINELKTDSSFNFNILN